MTDWLDGVIRFHFLAVFLCTMITHYQTFSSVHHFLILSFPYYAWFVLWLGFFVVITVVRLREWLTCSCLILFCLVFVLVCPQGSVPSASLFRAAVDESSYRSNDTRDCTRFAVCNPWCHTRMSLVNITCVPSPGDYAISIGLHVHQNAIFFLTCPLLCAVPLLLGNVHHGNLDQRIDDRLPLEDCPS